MTAREGTEEYAANLALAALKQPPIASLSDNNDRARAVKAVFAAARDATFRLQWWNFATAYDKPSAAANYQSAGLLKTAYPLAEDCIEVRFVQDAAADEWEVASAPVDPAAGALVPVLLTNLTAPVVCMTRRIEAVRLWDPNFLLAFSFQCGALAGPQMGASVARIGYCQEQADKWKEDGAGVDAREKSKSKVNRSPSWVSARRRGGSRSHG